MSLPKVLIIGQPFKNDTGGGVTLSNLFANWDRDKLAVACSGYLLLKNIDTSACNTYYQLGEYEHKYIFPLSLIKRKYPSGLVKLKPKKRYQDLSIPKSSLRVYLIMNYMIPLMKYLGFIHFIDKKVVSKEFQNWLDEYQPDIIYAQANSLQDLSFCIATHDYVKKPMVFHMMDDWPTIIKHNGLFKKYWYRKVDKQMRKLQARCQLLMSIGDLMSKEYKERYGKTFIPFHNPIDVNFWQQHQRTNYELSSSPIILYSGRTGLGIDSSLITLSEVIEMINEEHNMKIRLRVQSREKPNWMDKYPNTEHKSLIPYKDLPRAFAEADFLFLPHDFNQKAINFFKLSMPTKASEFMVSGTPIIVFGPEETAVVNYTQRNQCACVVTKNSPSLLKEKLVELLMDLDFRKKIAQNAINLALQRHDKEVVSQSFQNEIINLAIPSSFEKLNV